MEIERKYLISQVPADLDSYPFHIIEQDIFRRTSRQNPTPG